MEDVLLIILLLIPFSSCSQRRLLLTGTLAKQPHGTVVLDALFDAPCLPVSSRVQRMVLTPLTGMIEGSQEYNEGLVKRLHKVGSIPVFRGHGNNELRLTAGKPLGRGTAVLG